MQYPIAKPQSRFIIAAVLAATLLGALLRLYHLGALSLWGDEIFSVRAAQWPWHTLIRSATHDHEINMVLYYALLHGWVALFGDGDAVVRAPSAIFSIASIPLVFLLTKELLRPYRYASWAGVGAAWLLALNAYSVQFAQEARSYSMVVFFVILSTYLMARAVSAHNTKVRKRYWVGYVVAIVAAVYAHIFAALVLGAQLAILLVLWLRDRRRFSTVQVLGACLALVAAIAPVAWIVAVGGDKLTWVPPLTWDYLYGRFLHNITGAGQAFLTVVVLALAFVGAGFACYRLYHGDREEVWRLSLILACCLVPFLVVIDYSVLVRPIFVDRFLMLIQPFLIVLVVLCLLGLANQRSLIPRLAGLTAFVLVIGMTFAATLDYYSHFKKEDIRGAAQYVSERFDARNDGVLYFIGRTDNMIQHYEPQLVPAVPTSDWNGLTDSGTEAQFDAIIPSSDRRLWLVVDRANTPARIDSLNHLRAALGNDYELVRSTPFYGITVLLYQRTS